MRQTSCFLTTPGFLQAKLFPVRQVLLDGPLTCEIGGGGRGGKLQFGKGHTSSLCQPIADSKCQKITSDQTINGLLFARCEALSCQKYRSTTCQQHVGAMTKNGPTWGNSKVKRSIRFFCKCMMDTPQATVHGGPNQAGVPRLLSIFVTS